MEEETPPVVSRRRPVDTRPIPCDLSTQDDDWNNPYDPALHLCLSEGESDGEINSDAVLDLSRCDSDPTSAEEEEVIAHTCLCQQPSISLKNFTPCCLSPRDQIASREIQMQVDFKDNLIGNGPKPSEIGARKEQRKYIAVMRKGNGSEYGAAKDMHLQLGF